MLSHPCTTLSHIQRQWSTPPASPEALGWCFLTIHRQERQNQAPYIHSLSLFSPPQEQHFQLFYPNPLAFFLDTKQIGYSLGSTE